MAIALIGAMIWLYFECTPEVLGTPLFVLLIACIVWCAENCIWIQSGEVYEPPDLIHTTHFGRTPMAEGGEAVEGVLGAQLIEHHKSHRSSHLYGPVPDA